MAQFKRTDGYALMNSVMAQLTGQDNYQVIDAEGFLDAGKVAMTYSTDEIFNALTIVGARLFTATRPYQAPLYLIDSINSGYFNNRIRKISYYSTWALPSGAFNTNLFTNLADGYDNGQNFNTANPPVAQSTKDMYEQHPVHPLEMNFMNSTVWQDCLTRYEDQIKIVFSSEDEWAKYWSGASCLQSFPASEAFPMSQLFTSGGQSRVLASQGQSVTMLQTNDASVSVLPLEIQD